MKEEKESKKNETGKIIKKEIKRVKGKRKLKWKSVCVPGGGGQQLKNKKRSQNNKVH